VPGLGKTKLLKAIEEEYQDLSYFALASDDIKEKLAGLLSAIADSIR
jgi:hypothetical protein